MVRGRHSVCSVIPRFCCTSWAPFRVLVLLMLLSEASTWVAWLLSCIISSRSTDSRLVRATSPMTRPYQFPFHFTTRMPWFYRQDIVSVHSIWISDWHTQMLTSPLVNSLPLTTLIAYRVVYYWSLVCYPGPMSWFLLFWIRPLAPCILLSDASYAGYVSYQKAEKTLVYQEKVRSPIPLVLPLIYLYTTSHP